MSFECLPHPAETRGDSASRSSRSGGTAAVVLDDRHPDAGAHTVGSDGRVDAMDVFELAALHFNSSRMSWLDFIAGSYYKLDYKVCYVVDDAMLSLAASTNRVHSASTNRR